MQGTAEITYSAVRRKIRRKPWMRSIFWLRHRWHSRLARVNGGGYVESMTVCPRCGVFIGDDGVTAGTITFAQDEALRMGI